MKAFLAAAATAASSTSSTTTRATGLPLPPTTPGATTTTTSTATTTTTVTPTPTLVRRNLLTAYGTISLLECQEIAKTYYGATRDRSCQNSAMLYNFISNSITDTALTELALESSKYMYGTNADGACFLKLLISKVQVDTISTVNVLRAAISKLDTKIVEYKGDLKLFHTYVKTLKSSMESYGESYPELLVNLFGAYQAIEDHDFHAYIMMRKGMWEDGTTSFTANHLMNLVENHYKSRVENGTWKMVTKKDERIVALEAQVLALTTSVKTSSSKKSGLTKEERDKKYAWKTIPPSNEAEKKNGKVFENRQYHWCTKHLAWTIHSDKECKGVGAFKNRTQSSESSAPTNPTPTVTVDSALTSTVSDREPLVL